MTPNWPSGRKETTILLPPPVTSPRDEDEERDSLHDRYMVRFCVLYGIEVTYEADERDNEFFFGSW